MVQGDIEQIEGVLSDREDISEWECTDMKDGTVSVHIKTEGSDTKELCCQLFFMFAEQKLPIFEMNTRKASLEDVFIELTEGNNGDTDETDQDSLSYSSGNAFPAIEQQESGDVSLGKIQAGSEADEK